MATRDRRRHGLAVVALCAVLWAEWELPRRHIETGVDEYRGIGREYAGEYAASAVEQAIVQNNWAIRVPSKPPTALRT